jgi:acetyltransferase-like isoleucine patch superfamily enzyme
MGAITFWLRRTFGPLLPEGVRRKIAPLANPRVAKTVQLDQRHKISLGPDVFIDRYSILRPAEGTISIQGNSYIGPFCVILASGGVTIATDVMVGPHTVIASGNHDFKQTKLPMKQCPMLAAGPIVIEEDVWIGSHCLIVDNVTIGKGCVIGGGSVVTKSTEPYGIYAGVPARKIGSRLEQK